MLGVAVNGEARDRAIALLSSIDAGCAEEIVACPGGHAVTDTRHPALWSANHLHVNADEPPDAAGLHAVAVSHFARLGFELITVRHEPVARALTAPLAALGYRPVHELLMLLGERPVAVDAPAPILEVKPADLEASRIAAQLEAGRGAHVGRQLGSRDRLIARIAAQRCFAVVLSGEVVARCQLYSRAGRSSGATSSVSANRLTALDQLGRPTDRSVRTVKRERTSERAPTDFARGADPGGN
jgi:hypothetical protein